ncbi:MAG: metallophosphoesterase [Planctomycetia bacterium]|nr:metallophosphoesterase [Planctomycetia bacterium]
MPPSETRRRFLQCSAAAVSSALIPSFVPPFLPGGSAAASERGAEPTRSFRLEENCATFALPQLQKEFKVVFLADTHLFMDDERGLPFREFSARMAGAYHQNRHWKGDRVVTPGEAFEETLELARAEGAELIALGGDIFSFPSEAAIDWALERLETSKIPYAYTSGNHDWHYEGLPGTSRELRETWTQKRLLPLYRGRDPMNFAVELHGVKMLFIDDSIYEILPTQLDFLRRELSSGAPTLLFMHIPPYAPGRGVSYGVGHPDWNADHDPHWKIERRPQWPTEGHSLTTMDFYREITSAPNLLGILCGHIHRQTLDMLNARPSLVVGSNASGASITIRFTKNLEAK